MTPFTGDMHNRFVISHENITESKIAEEELRASQAQLAHIVRMGTMGELAAGIAHELNQPLTAISNYASGCARRLEGDDLAAQRKAITFALEEIANESERAGIIIRRLREFVRKSDPKRELINLNESLAEAIGLVHHEARLRGVEVTTKLDSSIAMVFGDSIQLQQVLLNLLRNAVEAICGFSMGDAARPEQLRMLGQVMVVTRMPDPQSVIVEVIDDGPGLSIESIERVFEAFYTTKSAGLGLGLSLSASIVEAHGGTLRCGNRTDGGGAWFRMLLPKGHQEASKRPV
ncbi:MAG: ATP-binding protein [Planctomycetota bacterium]